MNTNPPPWKFKTISPMARALRGFGAGLVVFISLIFVFGALAIFGEGRVTFKALMALLIGLGGAGLGIYLFWKNKQSIAAIPGSFNPIRSVEKAQPFYVQFSTVGYARSLQGDGLVQFTDEILNIKGTSAFNFFLTGVFSLSGIVVAAALGFGTSSLIAGIVAYIFYASTKRPENLLIQSPRIKELKIDKGTVLLSYRGADFERVKFTVSSTDAERLYRELYTHYPASASEWSSWFSGEGNAENLIDN